MKRPLAVIIRKAVRASKVSVTVIARTAQVSVPTIYSIINGRTPAQSKLEDVIEALGIEWMTVADAYHAQRDMDKRARSGGKVKIEKVALPKDERMLLSRYRALPKAHKRIVMGMLGMVSREKPPN